MKEFWQKNKSAIIFIFFLFIPWRLLLFLAQVISTHIPLQRFGNGPLWQNFDGYHYQYIAHHGYGQYEQAFFPLFPITLFGIERIVPIGGMQSGLLLVSIFLLMGLFVFYKLLRLDLSDNQTRWTLAFFLFFITGFFLGSIYTEALFVLLVFSCLFLTRKHHFLWAAIIAGLASATRLVGVFLLAAIIIEYIVYLKTQQKKILQLKILFVISTLALISMGGLIGYIAYLWIAYKDPLLFVHALSGFQTGRTTSHIVLLPQVLFRYIRIFLSVPVFTHDFLIAFLEFITTVVFMGVLLAFWKKVRLSYLAFSLCALLLPTISGTLTSMPRYVLVAFPLFGIVGTVENKVIKITLFVISVILLLILCSFFLRGYFIA